MPEPFVRAFVALSIGEEVRARLADVQARLKRTRAHVAWVPAANIHLSLAFLGDVARDTVPLIAAALDEAAGPVAPFSFEVAGVGCFGSERSPRVIWAGVVGQEAVQSLQARVAASLQAIGIRLEERAYRAHLTLGRVRSPRGREELAKALAAVRDAAFGTVGVEAATLMQSRLRPAGAEYTPLHRTVLGGQDGH